MTKRQLEVLRMMRDQEEELAYEHGQAYVGEVRIAPRTVFALLRACAISHDSYSAEAGEGLELYHINEVGLELVRKPDTGGTNA